MVSVRLISWVVFVFSSSLASFLYFGSVFEKTIILLALTGYEMIIRAFSIKFTANGEPEEVTCPPLCRHVCSLWLRFRREEGAPAVSDLREGFLAA